MFSFCSHIALFCKFFTCTERTRVVHTCAELPVCLHFSRTGKEDLIVTTVTLCRTKKVSTEDDAGLGFLPASWCKPGFVDSSLKNLSEMGRSLAHSNCLQLTTFLESNAMDFITDTTSCYDF